MTQIIWIIEYFWWNKINLQLKISAILTYMQEIFQITAPIVPASAIINQLQETFLVIHSQLNDNTPITYPSIFICYLYWLRINPAPWIANNGTKWYTCIRSKSGKIGFEYSIDWNYVGNLYTPTPSQPIHNPCILNYKVCNFVG